MNLQIRFFLAVFVGIFGAIWITLEALAGNYVAVSVAFVAIALYLGSQIVAREVPLDGFILGMVFLGYLILGKGYTYLTFGSILFVSEVTLAICMIIYAVRVLSYDQTIVRWNHYTIALILFLFYSGLHLFFDYKQFGIWALRDSCLAYYILFFFLAYGLGDRAAFTKHVGRIVIPASMICLILMLVFTVMPDLAGDLIMASVVRGRPIFEPHVDVTRNAIFGLFAFSCAYVAARGRFSWFFYLLSSIALVQVIIAARGGAFVGLLLVFPFLWIGRQIRLEWFFTTAVAAIMAIAILAFVQDSSDRESIVYKLKDELSSFMVFGIDEAKTHGQGTSMWRLQWWGYLFEKVNNEAPLFGFGFGADISSGFYEEELGYTYEAAKGAEYTRGAHNAFFTILARLGYVGAAFFLLVIIAQMRSFIFALRLSIEGRLELIDYYLWGYCLSGFVITFVQYTWEAPYSAVPFWIIFGLAYRRLEVIRETKKLEVNEYAFNQPPSNNQILAPN